MLIIMNSSPAELTIYRVDETQECETSNPKVRKMALSVAGELHLQLGPVARALILSSCDDAGSVKSQLERAFDENPFDAAAAKMERSRACVVLQSNNASGSNDAGAASSTVLLDIPKLDLQASLSSDCIKKMVSCMLLPCSSLVSLFNNRVVLPSTGMQRGKERMEDAKASTG